MYGSDKRSKIKRWTLKQTNPKMLLLIALSFEVASFDSSNVRDFMKGLSHEILQGLKDIFIDRPSYIGYAAGSLKFYSGTIY